MIPSFAVKPPLSESAARLARPVLLPVALALLGALGAGPASAVPETEGIGQVGLLIGQARVVRKDGAVEPLKRGMFVFVGDRVETSASGHVHLRFIDNASVAVRPDSALEIQAYRFDAQRPADSEVRLQVDHGTTRSISGRATEVDKNRFRLNTPVAAIGVRGTDFIVQATESSMRATVAEGAIVVSALGEGCSAAGLGACGGADSRQLTSDMRNLMVEVQRGEPGARLVPVAKSLVTSKAGAEERMAATRAAETAARSAGLQAAEPHGRNDSAAADLLVIAAESLPDLNSRPNPAAQLAWGRYTISAALNDNVSVPFVIARLNRHETVGSAEYTLFRASDPGNPDRLLRAGDGQADFRLTRGQATYETAGAVEAASIDGGTLSLNFGRNTFATALALSAPSAGKAELRMAGDVRADGTFAVRDRDSAQYIAGAVSLDGKEAGYLFERGAGSGLFRGKTLWGR
jgi:hypothetical protein